MVQVQILLSKRSGQGTVCGIAPPRRGSGVKTCRVRGEACRAGISRLIAA